MLRYIVKKIKIKKISVTSSEIKVVENYKTLQIKGQLELFYNEKQNKKNKKKRI